MFDSKVFDKSKELQNSLPYYTFRFIIKLIVIIINWYKYKGMYKKFGVLIKADNYIIGKI